MSELTELQAAVERLGQASSHYDISIPDIDTVLDALEAAQQELVELRELLTTIRKIGTGESQVAEDDTAGLQVIVDKIDAAIQKAT